MRSLRRTLFSAGLAEARRSRKPAVEGSNYPIGCHSRSQELTIILVHISRARQPRAIIQHLLFSILDGLPRWLTKPKLVIASLALDPLSAVPSTCGSAPAQATRIRHCPVLTARTAFNVSLGRWSLNSSAISSTIIPAQQSRKLPCLWRWRPWTTNTLLDIHEEDERFSAVAQIRIIRTQIAC